MLDRLFAGTTVPVLEQVVNFAQQRHGVLAGNIANIDTPGYKTRDLSPQQFQEQLRDAIETRDAMQSPTSAGGAMSRIDPVREVAANMPDLLHHDESNVGLEQQVTELAKNQATHNMAIGILRSQFTLFEVAITERV